MDIEYLIEYQEKEFQILKNLQTLSNRFKNLNQPVFNLSTPCQSFWSQLPFSGTVIVPLSPQPEMYFEKAFNISVKDIPDLIKFTKETNKIQFVLCGDLKDYSKYGYLEPFFEELHPPMYIADISFDNDKNRELYKQSWIELTTLFELSPKFSKLNGLPNGMHLIDEYVRQYNSFRYFEFDEIADTFLDNIIINPEFASIYLETAYEMMIHPLLDPFKANIAISVDTIQRANKMGLQQNVDCGYPEIGSFLMTQTTNCAESITACKDLICRYKKEDLYNVYSSLRSAVNERNSTSIINNKNELEAIMKNIWEDTKIIRQNAVMYKYGMALTIGTIGFCITPLCGLLGSLGVSALSQTKSSFLDNYAELISKKVATPCMANIYDFQKKYHISQ
jgi:hypothetical protein